MARIALSGALLAGSLVMWTVLLNKPFAQPLLRLTPLRRLASGVRGAAPSPDNKWVAFVAKGDLWLVSLDGNSRRLVGRDQILWYDWSPDGKKIAVAKRGTQKARVDVTEVETGQTTPCGEFDPSRQSIQWIDGRCVIYPRRPRAEYFAQPLWVKRVEEQLTARSEPIPPLGPSSRSAKRWEVHDWAPNERVVLLGERCHPLYETFKYHLGLLDEKREIKQLVPLPALERGRMVFTCWYPDYRKVLVVVRYEGGGLRAPDIPRVRDYLYLVSADGKCHGMKTEYRFFRRIWLTDARNHLYLYITDNDELWTGMLEGVR